MDDRRYNIFMDNLEPNNQNEETLDDITFRHKTTEEITRRDKFYSDILEHFVSVTKTRNYLREFFKWLFLCVLIAAILHLTNGLVGLFQRYITDATISEITEAIPLFITSIVSFVSVVIAIPLTITKYLFSTTEDENITQIILHTQNHDTSGRQWVKPTINESDNSNIIQESDSSNVIQESVVQDGQSESIENT